MPHPTQSREAADRAVTMSAEAAREKRDRAAFSDWHVREFESEVVWSPTLHMPIGDTERKRYAAYLAGAEHGRAEAPLGDAYRRPDAAMDQLRTDLAATITATRAEIARVEAERDGLVVERRTWEQLAREYHRLIGKTPTPAPSPHAELREAVCEAAMAHYRSVDPKEIPGWWRDEARAVRAACAALDAATPKPSEAVKEAAGRLRAHVDGVTWRPGDQIWASAADLATVLDALGAKVAE